MGGRFSFDQLSDPSSIWDEYFQPQPLDSLYSHEDDIRSPTQQNPPSLPLPCQRSDPSPPPSPELSYTYSLEHVIEAFAAVTLGASNFIVGIDFTKSNEWTGARTFNGKSLHHIQEYHMNPYEAAISVVSKTLTPLDGDTSVFSFGFGDVSTTDQDVFTFNANNNFCNGFEGVLSRYREIVPHLIFAGPTSFGPIIEMATTIVEQSYGQYHVLLIIADGQVTRSVDTEPGKLSPQEHRTFQAIVEASNYPLSIILVGVGDGPWDTMREFEKNILARSFNNFRFVNFTKIMSKNVVPRQKEAEFARSALMETPSQYKAMIELDLIGWKRGKSPQRVPLPPPIRVPSVLPNYRRPQLGNVAPSAPPASSSSSYNSQICPICYTEDKDMAFGCGHQTCCECGKDLETCPICRRPITFRLKLF